MTKKKTPAAPAEPLRGEAAYRARKEEISRRNDATRPRGAAERSAREAEQASKRQAAERHEAANLPEQPQR